MPGAPRRRGPGWREARAAARCAAAVPPIAPYWAPATPPTIRMKARTMSTFWLVAAMDNGRVAGHEDDLEQRRADDHVGGHLKQVDQRRHQ